VRESLRSRCPVSLALEVFGDRWTLLIIRDLMFAGKRHFREFLRSDEEISTRILSDRLGALVREGIVTRSEDPTHKQKAVYSLTEKGITLLPVIAQIGIWGKQFCPTTPESAATAASLERGGPAYWKRLMAELRRSHAEASPSSRRPVSATGRRPATNKAL
jgi:DNA-binding HxlR family transcriptional regulator